MVTDPHTRTHKHTHSYPATHRQDQLQYTAPQLARSVITGRNASHSGSGTLSILPFMVKMDVRYTRRADGRRWGVYGVTTVSGRDCIAVACYAQQCSLLLEHNAQNRIKLQPTSEIMSRSQRSCSLILFSSQQASLRRRMRREH